MSYKVGIPRALLYYKYFPMWGAFLKRLGADIVVSESTNQKMITQGAARVVSDTCLPLKVFIGHVVSLIGRCDRLLIPVVRSTKKKVYNCSRFLGLPDLTRAVVPESPPILEIEFDYSRGERYLHRQIYSLGKNFTKNPREIKEASQYAWETHLNYNRMTVEQNLTRMEAIDLLMGKKIDKQKDDSTKLTIGLAGHPYVLHDEQVSHNLIKRLRSEGIKVLTPEMVPIIPDSGDNGQVEFAGLAKNYWESEEDVVGAGEYYAKRRVDGIIGAMAFACGPDSLMMNLVQRQAHTAGIPYMCLTVEEHTAEAGVVTRLEAFLDMIYRTKRREESCV
jgi:predicted nucleotide-binding protein (sugar kinase/HSP70/actin superfamily)